MHPESLQEWPVEQVSFRSALWNTGGTFERIRSLLQPHQNTLHRRPTKSNPLVQCGWYNFSFLCEIQGMDEGHPRTWGSWPTVTGYDFLISPNKSIFYSKPYMASRASVDRGLLRKSSNTSRGWREPPLASIVSRNLRKKPESKLPLETRGLTCMLCTQYR